MSGRIVRRVARPLPAPAVPLVAPTDLNPRWRLRVFDRCWPWRATRREVLRDAILSFNARWDADDRVFYLDAAASVQRDPPDAITRGYRELRRREAQRLEGGER